MARNYNELRARMDPVRRAQNDLLVRQELQRMALEELRTAKQLTQADLAEVLDVPQSSISRIERRTDMYLSTLRNYVQAMGGVLQIQAIFPDGGAVVIDRFGDYENQPYVLWARAESGGAYRLQARPFHHEGATLSIKSSKLSALVKAMKNLHLSESQVSAIRKSLENSSEVQIGAGAGGVPRIFSAPDLMAAGFEATGT
jgi:transcriptional regulator with XRE-family HTH domain